MAQRLKTDWVLFWTIIALVTFGLVIVFSASSIVAQWKFHSTYYFLVRQFAWMLGALALMMYLKNRNYRLLKSPVVAFTLLGTAYILLLIVYFLDPFHRWLRAGPLSLQPAELAKPALIIFLAYFVAHRARAINTRETLFPALLTVGLVTLLVLIADLGTAVVLAASAAVIFFVAGLNWRYCLLGAGIAVVAVTIGIVSKPYRLARVIEYVDPQYRVVDTIDPQGRLKAYLKKSLATHDTRYQAEQSVLAVSSGGPLGRGLMRSIQKLFYLPESHTDFIYAVVSEETGLIGSIGIFAGFLLILWRGLRAAVRAPDDFGRLLALGITAAVVVQGFMNMSVVLDLMPTKGIPLPLISSGGSSLLSTLASLGILMNVSEHVG